MRNAYVKDCLRQIRNTSHRFFAILIISALGVAFFSGLRTTGDDMRITAEKFYNDLHFFDIHLISSNGFTDDDLEKIRSIDGVEAVNTCFTLDALTVTNDVNSTVKLLSYDDKSTINKPNLVEGKLPTKSSECLADAKYVKQTGCSVGDEITLISGSETPITAMIATDKVTIVGIVENPLYISIDRGSSTVGSGKANSFLMIFSENFLLPVYTDIYVTVFNEENLSRFEEQYIEHITPVMNSIEEKDQSWHILNLESNVGFSGYLQDADRIDALSLVIPLLFFMIAILVNMTSMTRLVESDRSFIGTLKALGYSNRAIAYRYLLYALSASVIGGMIGLVAGYNIFPRVVFDAYSVLYTLPSIEIVYNSFYSFISVGAAVLCAALPAYFICVTSLRTSAANLMRPVSPKIGKRTLIEKITPIWKRFNFSQKVAFRNLFRYKKRLYMTIIGVAGCTALMFAGFGLRDSITTIVDKQYSEIHLYNLELYYSETSNIDEIIKNYSEISAYSPVFSDTCEVTNGTKTTDAYITVPAKTDDFSSYIVLRNRLTKEDLSLDNGVVITEKLASIYDLSVGDTMNIRDSEGDTAEVTISGIAENYLVHYIYISKAMYHDLFSKEAVSNSVLCNTVVGTDDSLLAEKLLAEENIKSIMITDNSAKDFSKMTDALRYVVLVLIVSAAILVFVVLFSLNTINLEERKRELATIKVLGFYNRELAAYMIRENAVLTVFGTILGLGLGVILQRYIIVTMEVDMVMFSRDLLWSSFVFSAFLTLLFATAVNMMMLKPISKIDVVSSMKSIE